MTERRDDITAWLRDQEEMGCREAADEITRLRAECKAWHSADMERWCAAALAVFPNLEEHEGDWPGWPEILNEAKRLRGQHTDLMAAVGLALEADAVAEWQDAEGDGLRSTYRKLLAPEEG